MSTFNTTGVLQGPPYVSSGSGDTNGEVSPTEEELDTLDALQMLLDIIGLIPGAGAPADIINGLISAARGDWIGAGLSLFGVVPVAGEAATVGKIIAKSEKYLQALKVVERKVLPNLPGPVRRTLEEALEKARNKIDELTGKKPEPPPKPKDADAAKKPPEGGGVKGHGRDCRLRTYKEGCPGGRTPHHVVPDRVFRMPNGQRLPGGLSHAEGYTICVDGATPRKRGTRANEHGAIHDIYDLEEAALGALGDPRGTAELIKLELAGVAAASKITGCNPLIIAAQLRAYHQSKGLSPSMKFRADPRGSMIRGVDPGSLGTGASPSGLGGI